MPNLGVKKIQALHAALGISSVAALKEACLAGRVRGVKGFGEKTESKILEGIQRYEERSERVLLYDALEAGERVMARLREAPEVEAVELSGSARRGDETVSDLDLVVVSRDAPMVASTLRRAPSVVEVDARPGGRIAARLASGLALDLFVVPPRELGGALVRGTGSAAHVARLDALAAAKGISSTESGATEEAQYARLGLPFIPPELREDQGEIEEALAAAGARRGPRGSTRSPTWSRCTTCAA